MSARKISKSSYQRPRKTLKTEVYLKEENKWKSPLRIVDRLLEDANERLKNKKKLEKFGRDPSVAKTVNEWNGTLRNKSAQPTRKLGTRSRIDSTSSYRSGNSQYRSINSS
mmetsp:Transcript_2379/g.2244  ORF Transcript_2379/g.2244 Transcript_2379/m.2244 type:complete len:111 (-) Transcript_2379:415-747(-)